MPRSHNGEIANGFIGEMQVSWQHPILEIKNFITFGKAVNGSSSFVRLLCSSLTPNNKQSGDLLSLREKKKRELQFHQSHGKWNCRVCVTRSLALSRLANFG